ncbi:MAG: RES domain-containing protein [Mesorhizobium sp.]|uniref:RES family NAD+ phosphorylase n=1 Tax=Mesorhizobium sp. TaxID=1871066 RepID=UPI000FEAB317|nr:RES family NAD+ phosphorylase [Mesorhizobium sp.]RWE90453.1 MAG: RES domain-containing protein [Mesorhizobium sp.]TIV51830.1 MAG: RES domain-containing protein [Mesorhizobium sp.]
MKSRKRTARRGPSGVAPPPPDWLAGISLPIEEIKAGQILHRVHRSSFDPIFFSPGPDVPPTSRFDSASGRFGVLYCALSLRGALAETLLRNPQRLMVASTDIVSRSATSLVSVRPLRVVRLHGAGLQMVGTDNAVSTGPYEPCGLWSDALWDHKDQPDGLAYQSRHDSSEICLALFQRANVRLSARETFPLSQTLRTVADVLDIFGKSVSEPPE